MLDIRRRLLDKSALITSFVAPFLLASILGLAFGNSQSSGVMTIGIAFSNPNSYVRNLSNAGLASASLPALIKVDKNLTVANLEREVKLNKISAGVILDGSLGSPSNIESLVNDVNGLLSATFVHPNDTKVNIGIDVVSGSSSLAGQVAQGIAASILGRIYNGILVATVVSSNRTGYSATIPKSEQTKTFFRIAESSAITPLPFILKNDNFGTGRNVIGYFAPSMAVVFLFIGAGLGARSIVQERGEGTLARLAASPVKSGAIVFGKMASIIVMSLVSVFLLWGETVLIFGASWGDPTGVIAMCVATTLAMCGLSIFLTSLAKTEQQAFNASVIVGFVLALIGGNFFPPGSLPPFMQTLSLFTPNGWALVGFGRLSQEGLGFTGILGPIEVLGSIALVFVVASLFRIGRVIEL